MTDRKALDRIAQSTGAKQTGVRFQYSCFPLQTTDCGACTTHPQIVIMEV